MEVGQRIKRLNRKGRGGPRWLSGLRIQHCHCYGKELAWELLHAEGLAKKKKKRKKMQLGFLEEKRKLRGPKIKQISMKGRSWKFLYKI